MIRVSRKRLLEGLNVVAPATKAGQRPVLHCVKLHPAGVLLGLDATDIETYISTTAQQDSGAWEATLAVPHAPLKAFVSGAGDFLDLEATADSLTVQSAGSTLTLRAIQDDFPVRQIVDNPPVFLSADLVAQLATVVYAASKDNARPILTGICVRDGWAVATDSYRLSAVKVESGIPDCLIPAGFLETVIKHEPDGFSLSVDSYRASATVGETMWTTRLIEGQFPNWRGLVAESKNKFTCERADLIGAIEQVDIFGTPYLKLEPAGDSQVRLWSHDESGNEASAVIDGQLPVEKIAFTLKYLRDLVKVAPGDLFELGLVDMSKPGSIVTESRIDLIMPVRS